MEFIIKYADDNDKKERFINYVKDHPGARVYNILNGVGLCNQTYHKLVKELQASGDIVIRLEERGAMAHYCN